MPNDLQPWKEIKRELVLKNKWVEINNHTYTIPPNDKLAEFVLLNEAQGANIIPKTADGQFLVNKQYRPAMGKVVYDFPAGAIEEGEDKLVAAKRELLEETGYESDDWTYTGIVNAAVYRSNKTDYCFLARNIKKVAQQKLDENEEINVELISLDKLHQLIKSNQFNCGICLSSLYRANLI